VHARGAREQGIFDLALDNHRVLLKQYLDAIAAMGDTDPQAEFDRLYVLHADGVTRNRPEGFDGTRDVGVCIGAGQTIDADLRRRVLAARQVIAEAGPAWHNRFQDLYITLPENAMILYFRCDPLRLRQVLTNLVGNAIKFTEQGEVTVRISASDVPNTRSVVRFEIIDSGTGMTAEQLDRLFQPFSQADASTTRRFGGTGLGLIISQRLVAMLGGTIDVRSEYRKGHDDARLQAERDDDALRRDLAAHGSADRDMPAPSSARGVPEAQASQGEAVAEASSALSSALHSDEQLVAEPDRAVVQGDHGQADPPRRVPEREGADHRDRVVHRRAQPRSEDVQVDRQGRDDSGKGAPREGGG